MPRGGTPVEPQGGCGWEYHRVWGEQSEVPAPFRQPDTGGPVHKIPAAAELWLRKEVGEA